MPRNSFVKNVRFSKSKLALAITAHMLAASNVLAAPAGGEVVGGSGTIQQRGAETTITQNTDRLAIDWQNFDVGKNERVEFVQPGQSAVALNRILGNKGSEILGRIDANGQVILVNPRGVVFGEGAVINAGGLIASGLQINPEDFMNGDLVFKRIEDMDGTVINSGMINAAAGGNVALLGAHVENRGLISAKLGTVILASGKEAVLTFDESGLLGVRVDQAILQEELGATAAVKNSGEIVAENGRVLLSASTTRDVFSQAINWGDQKQARSVAYNEDGSFTLGAGGNIENSGTVDVSSTESAGVVIALAENVTHTGSIHADAVHGQGGLVELHSNTTTLVAEEGVVTANGATGGDIKLLGKNVGLFDRAAVDGIGANGGGTALVGGDREGFNDGVRNADFVYVGEGSKIDVSATDVGDGGVAIIFAEHTARIYGDLSAKGGEYGGDGGFVETSGKHGFEIEGSPNISAANGVAGHWLIDPINLEIADSNTQFVNHQGDEFTSTVPPSNRISRLDINDLMDVLESDGATVTVKTGSDTEGAGNITVSTEIRLTQNVSSTLNLIAHNSIVINANIGAVDVATVNGQSARNKVAGRKLNLHLNANTSISNNPNSQGSITFGDNVRIETGGGDFVVGQDVQTATDGSVISAASLGAYNVNFSNATIDVIRAAYSDQELRQLYVNRNTAVTSGQSQHLAPSGRVVINASNDVTLGQMKIKGREVEGSPKVAIRAGHDIVMNQDLLFDNNPTEILQSGQESNDGYTTLQLIAGNDIRLNGRIRREFPNTNASWLDHQDRLRIELTADDDKVNGGDVMIADSQETEIATIGGDFIIQNAVNVDLSSRIIDTRSRFGAGDVSITASGNITLGSLPMFGQNAEAGTLRNPSLTAIAGRTLDIGNNDIYTRGNDVSDDDIRGGDIHLGATVWEVDGRTLVTRDGGNITLTTAGDLDLPVLNSSGNITLSNTSEGEVTEGEGFEVTGNTQGMRLDGVLTLALSKNGSADIANITNNSTAATANLVITSARDVQLGINGAITLGDSAVSGKLALTSAAGIVQEAETKLVVEGMSTFNVDNGSVILNQLENNFVEAVSVVGTNVQDVDLSSVGNLIFGGVDADTLSATSGGNITQEENLSVTGAAHLSAGGDITLAASNQFTTLSIAQAGAAKITNQQSLELASIQNTLTLDLTVSEGNLTQSTALNLDELILNVNGNVELAQPTNTIGALTGVVGSGVVLAAGSMLLGEFSVAGSEGFALSLSGDEAKFSQVDNATFATNSTATISAAQVDINSTIQLQNNAGLTFENVVDFILRGALQGEDAATNSVAVNGTTDNGIYTVTNTATWEKVSLALNGGAGSDTLHGPDLDAIWNIQSVESAEPHTLETAQGELLFQSMEILEGGTGDDNFAFADAAPTNLALNGGDGEGEDTADYSGIMSSIRVPLGSNAGLSGIENIVGNGISALVAQGDTANIWMLSGADAGTVTPSGSTGMTFKGFNELVGGAGADEFIVAADLVVSSQLDGGGGLNTLQGLDTDQLWIVSGNKDAPLVTLAQPAAGNEPNRILVTDAQGITGMLGGEGKDIFQYLIADSRVGADGGAGANTAEFLIDADYTVSLGTLNDRGISNVAKVAGNATAGFASTLEIVGESDNVWTFNAEIPHKVKRGEEEIEFENFDGFLGGAGADRFNLFASPAGRINGRGGNDGFYLLAPEITADLVGGDGDDTLRAYQQAANLWSIDEPTSTLRGTSELEPAVNAVGFSDMEVLEGAADYSDTFGFQNLPDRQPVIRAGNGMAVDTIDYSALTVAVPVTLGSTGLTGFERVIGNGALSTLTGADAPSTWTLSPEGGSGQVQWTQNNIAQTTIFSGFGHWVGGSANDSFSLLTLDGAPASIRGGGGADELDLSSVAAGADVGVGLDAGRPLNIAEIETLNANATFTNLLTSSAEQSDWRIDGPNSGTLTGDDATALVFQDFQQLQGLHANVFDLQAEGVLAAEDGPGGVRGGDGESSLTVRGDAAHTWTVEGAGRGVVVRSDAPLLNFDGINNLHGGEGADDFVLTDSKASITGIRAGAGDNSLSTVWEGDNLLEWQVVDGVGSLLGRVTVFEGIRRIQGREGRDLFLLSGTTSMLEINSGAGDDLISLIETASVDRITSGAGSDTISLAGSATVADPIDGGGQPEGGRDHLDLSDYDRALNWNLADQKIGDFLYTDVEQISAPAKFTNTLQGPDRSNTWTITGENSGTLDTGDGRTFDFAGISQLLGGALEDVFLLAGGSVSGNLDGGDGANRLKGNDAANQWSISGENSGTLTSTAGGVAAFQRIQSLTGGGQADQFTFDGGHLSSWLAGGAGSDQVLYDQQPVSVWLAGTDGKGPDAEGWHLLRRDVESIATAFSPQSHLQLESETASEWRITGFNQGALEQLTFSGFGRVTGGAGNDTFSFAAGASLIGLLDGGKGENIVDLIPLTGPVTVSEGRRRDGANLGITRIQAVRANPINAGNRLWADDRDNRWSIDGQNAGILNSDTARLSFSGFDNLSGGSLDDRFEFVATGDIGGQLDGGDHSTFDSVDYTARTSALIIDLRGESRLLNIETLVGNEKMTLMGPDLDTQWRITGLDTGQLVYGTDPEIQRLNFSGVGRLAGGLARDEFVFSGGALSGGVGGGAGDDRFVFQLQDDSSNRATRLDGAAGADSLLVEGGGIGWSGVYSLGAEGQSQLVFQSTTGGTAFAHAGFESALVTAELAGMGIHALPTTQTVKLAGPSWQLDEHLPVFYRSGIAGLEVKAGVETLIQISDDLNLSRNLSLLGGTVVAETGASISASELSLVNVLGVGTANAPLMLSVDQLRLVGGGPVYLRETDGLELAELQDGAGLDLVVHAGNLSQSATIVTDAPLRLVAERGSVQLDNSANQIGGGVQLEAAADVRIYNSLDIHLAAVQAHNLMVGSSGAITSDAPLIVSNITRLISTGDLVLTHAENQLDQVFLTSDGAASLTNSRILTLVETQVAGHLDVEAASLNIVGEVFAASVTGKVGTGGLVIANSLQALGDIRLDSTGALLMQEQGRIVSTEGDIALFSSDTQALGLLSALEGEVQLNSGAAIVDVNDSGDPLNIKAKRFIARAVSGIGSFNALDLDVESLDVVNQSEAVALSNTGPLTVERLRNGGNITLENDTHVTFLKHSANAFFGTEEPQYPESKRVEDIPSNLDFHFQLWLDKGGTIGTDGTLAFTEPHISGYRVTIRNPHGSFLFPPPVIYAPGELTITSGSSPQGPEYGFGIEPKVLNDETPYYKDVMGAGEQLIEVETLSDIDPAIFTPVKNYIYQEVSIRLPSDQLYEDE